MLSERHIPFVITLTGTDYNGRVSGSRSSTLLKRSLLRAAGLVVFHDEAYGVLKATHPSVTEKVSVIPQGVAVFQDRLDRSSVRAEFSLNENDLVFMTVSGIRPVKNIGYALDAFAQIKKQVSNAMLLLVGPVIDKDEARRVLERGEREQPGFIYLGDQPHIVVKSLLSAADIYLNTSFHEGMSGAVLEAMASGLPVLATRVPGNRSLIRNNQNGLLVDLDNPKELVHAALKLASDKSLRKRLGDRGRQLASGYHSIEEEIDRYEDLYETILLSLSA
jgi:glycosyltransferase involved in cell wall biosynthesis